MEHLLVPLPYGIFYIVHNGILGHGADTALNEAQSRLCFLRDIKRREIGQSTACICQLQPPISESFAVACWQLSEDLAFSTDILRRAALPPHSRSVKRSGVLPLSRL